MPPARAGLCCSRALPVQYRDIVPCVSRLPPVSFIFSTRPARRLRHGVSSFDGTVPTIGTDNIHEGMQARGSRHSTRVSSDVLPSHRHIQHGAIRQTRVGPAFVHLVQGIIIMMSCILAIGPVWLTFGFCIAVLTPPTVLGLGSPCEAVGIPHYWLRWRTFPRVLLMKIFFDLPLAIVLWLYCAFGLCIVTKAARVVFEIRRALLKHHPSDGPLEHPISLSSLPCPDSVTLEAPPSSITRAGSGRLTLSNANAAQRDGSRYRAHASIWAALEGDGEKVKPGDVRLLSLTWLMALADRGGVLPRRQDLPHEAFIDAACLRNIERDARRSWDGQGFDEKTRSLATGGGLPAMFALFAAAFGSKRNVDNLLPIVAVSYCWLEAAHPDRDGRQLRLLCDRLRRLYGGRGLLGVCQEYGFSDMGIFLDWGSGYQKDPMLWRDWMTDWATFGLSDEDLEKSAVDGVKKVAERRAYEASRTPEQKDAFHRMLHNTMDLWYAHAAVTVVLLTLLPEELPPGFDTSRTYSRRGWTMFERCSAELAAKSCRLHVAKWKLVIDVADESGGAQRRLPTTPERMEALLAGCQFTNGADRQAVIKLYEQTAKRILGSIDELEYKGQPLLCDDPWASPEKLAEALNWCTSLRRLHLSGTQLDDEGATRLAAGLNDGALPALKHLRLSSNRYGVRGVGELCSIFRRGVAPRLSGLTIAWIPFGDAGAAAVASALASGCMPPSVTVLMFGTDMGDDGARALAAALPSAGPGCNVNCAFNRIGLVGQSALLRALEAKHGPGSTHLIPVAFNGFPWPAALSRALARGIRRGHESGRMF